MKAPFCKAVSIAIVIFAGLFLCKEYGPSREADVQHFALSSEERVQLEKFFRYFLFNESCVYTLFGSKPITSIDYIHKEIDYHQYTPEEIEEFQYLILNQGNHAHWELYKNFALKNKKKCFLVSEKNYIYDFYELWKVWEKIESRFPLSDKFLLVRKERRVLPWDRDQVDEAFDIYFINTQSAARVMQENYEAFKQVSGRDFDPVSLVLEIKDSGSEFWGKMCGREGVKYCHLWGLLYGFGETNSCSYLRRCSHFKESPESQQEAVENLKSKPSYTLLVPTEPHAFTTHKFSIPAFASFSKNDPMIARYKKERSEIRKIYWGKDFVDVTLSYLTQPTPVNESAD